MYSFVMSRLINCIVNTCQLLPETKIFLYKINLDAAYRRCSLLSLTSWESMTTYDSLLLVALWMTFGGSPCLNLWEVLSETIADVANSILHNPVWDHNHLYDPMSDSIDSPKTLLDDIPFQRARDVAVVLPDNLGGYIDIYIDDNLGVTPDIGDNMTRLNRVLPLAIYTIVRPKDTLDILPRKDIISMKKFKAEGQLEEVKTVL